MGVALLAISALFAPLQELAARLTPPHRTHRARGLRRPPCPDGTGLSALHAPTLPASPVHATGGAQEALKPPKPLQLRVVRTIEAGRPAGDAGRMVISGRMADVCAELERLAALEGARESTVKH